MSESFESATPAPRRRKGSKREDWKQKKAAEDTGDRLPPNAGEAEAAALACCFLEPAECLNTCEERGVGRAWFYDLRWQLVFTAMAELHAAGKGVDVITVQQVLRGRDELDQVGGIAVLSQLPDLVPSAANLPHYLDILKDKLLERQMLAISAELSAGVYDVVDGEASDPHALLARAERQVLRLGEESAQEREQHIKEILKGVVDDIENYHRGGAQMRGLATGIEYADKLLCGVGGDNGNYLVLGARPGTGKTSFVTQFLTYAASDYVWWKPILENGKHKVGPDGRLMFERRVGVPVAMFSLEMAARPLMQRVLFQNAHADLQRWRTGFATEDDLKPLEKSIAKLKGIPFYIDDTGRCTIDSLRAKARRMHRQYGIKLFAIDYIQLMRAGGKRFREDRVQELAEISGEIQALGKELNVPFLVLAQMNREYEKDPKRAPRLSDLKDCGAIEQDADVVAFLYEPKLKDAQEQKFEEALDAVCGKEEVRDWTRTPRLIDLFVAKNRYGPTGAARMLFHKHCTRFEDYYAWLKANGLMAKAKGEGETQEDVPGFDKPPEEDGQEI